MTVAELILALQQHDPKLRVILRGYEGGYDDVVRTAEMQIALGVNEEWYYGKHEDAAAGCVKDSSKYACENAVLIV